MLKNFPIKDGIVLGHISPDADSVCSCIAFVEFLRKNKKEAFFFVPEYVPRHIQWILDENQDLILKDKNHPFFKKNNVFYVLDCEPSKARTGFTFHKNNEIINIDHHNSRFSDVSKDIFNYKDYFFDKVIFEEKEILLYLENRVSTCSILFSAFNIVNPLLAIGIYFDSVSLSLHINDSINIISSLNIEEEKLNTMIEKTKYHGNKEGWEALKNLSVWWDDEESIVFAFDNSKCMDSNQIIFILNQYVDTVIFFHKNKNVSMRTSNKEIDVAKIAKQRQGGGHRGASGFRIKKKLELYKIVEEIRKNKLSNEEKKQLKFFEDKIYNFFRNSNKRK